MDFFRLLWLNLIVSLKNMIEYCRVVCRYYKHAKFRKTDLALLRGYLLKNPFRISKKFLQELGAADVYAYGETPLTSMDMIARECSISSKDIVFELGCGRGRSCFWLNAFRGCRVVGVEFIPQFVEKAEAVREKYAVEGVEFRLEDMLKTNMSAGTVIYLYGTCYDEEFVTALIEKFKRQPQGTRIITVSYALEEYGSEDFVTQRCFPVPFTWGVGDVYLQIRK